MIALLRILVGGLLLIPVACVGTTSATSGNSGGSSWEGEVRAAEQRHRAAFLANDVAALQAMFSDDFVVNSPMNVIVDKARLLEMVRNGMLAISSFDQNIEQVRRFGDVVVVMGGDTVVYAAPSPNAGQTHRRRFTDL